MTASSYLAVASVLPAEDHHLAIDYLQHVIKIYNHRGLPNHKNMMISYQQLGNCYRKQHDHPQALQCYKEALQRSRTGKLAHGNPFWILLHVDIALEYLCLNDYDHAVEEYKEALEHVTEESSKSSKMQQNLTLGRQRILEYDVQCTINEMIGSIASTDSTKITHDSQ